jgi:Acetyltransferase (GNAT) domain
MSTIISTFTADESHFKALIELGKTYYPQDHAVLTEAFLRWFYLDNPAGKATLIVASEQDLWIGLIVLIPTVLIHNGQKQKACYAVNVLTHPEHRGKNLFVKMITHALIDLNHSGTWLLGHPNANAVPGWKRKKMSFRDPLKLRLAKFRLPFSGISEKRIESIEELLTIDDSFWNSLSKRNDIHIEHTPEFIAWRFLNAPHKNYVVSAVHKKDCLIGLKVTRKFKGPVDLMIDFISPLADIGTLLSSVLRPTLILNSGVGDTKEVVKNGSWQLPIKREFPFFVTTIEPIDNIAFTGITLTASDF